MAKSNACKRERTGSVEKDGRMDRWSLRRSLDRHRISSPSHSRYEDGTVTVVVVVVVDVVGGRPQAVALLRDDKCLSWKENAPWSSYREAEIKRRRRKLLRRRGGAMVKVMTCAYVRTYRTLTIFDLLTLIRP